MYCITFQDLSYCEWVQVIVTCQQLVQFQVCWRFAFLALLCATAQQGYCRHAGVCGPSSVRLSVVRSLSVKPVFSELIKQINATFGGSVPFHHISMPFFFQNFAFLIFYDFFSFSLTWDHMGEKKLPTTSPLKLHKRFTPKNSCILLGRVSTKVV